MSNAEMKMIIINITHFSLFITVLVPLHRRQQHLEPKPFIIKFP